MLTDITIGQFFPGTSVLHRMDPRTKLLLLIVLMARFSSLIRRAGMRF